MNEFVYDVISGAAEGIFTQEREHYYDHSNVVIIGDDHEIVPLFCGAAYGLKKYCTELNVHYIQSGSDTDKGKQTEAFFAHWPELSTWGSLDEYAAAQKAEADPHRRELFFVFANLRSSRYSEEGSRNEKARQLRELMDLCAEQKNRELLLVTCVPFMDDPLPEGLNAIAEREYEVVFRDKPEDSPEKFVCHLEDIIRSNRELVPRAQVVRLDRVFGPGITNPDGLCIIEILKEMDSAHSVTISDGDRREYFSAAYVKDALFAILAVKAQGQGGNIYNVSSWPLTRFQVVTQTLDRVPEFNCELVSGSNTEADDRFSYRILNSSKLDTLSIKQSLLRTLLSEALKQTALWYLGTSHYVPKNDVNVYFGRMNRIRELELELLKEIDQICRENGIQYFISAGTMLGAVRHHGFIPWDDDVDIGMLPEDYEKFLRVCPKCLSADYSYQNSALEKESHYIHDKIRINNSWFATNYANARIMKNGVYIDIFVYYKTSDKPFFQKLHIKQILLARKMLAIRWATKDRKTNHRHIFLAMYYISKIIPFSWVHWYHRHVIRKYEKRNTHYRLDSTGFNLEKVGAVPDEWFHGTKDEVFCGQTFPVLARYNDYLSHWFGKKYMGYPPLSYRTSVHVVKRIDLGKTLFDETRHDPGLHEMDLRGELFDEYKSK